MADAVQTHEVAEDLIRKIVDESLSAIYVCDAHTCELLYLNARTAQIVNKQICEAKGKTCYEFLRGRKTRCENCFIDSATREYSVREYASKASGKSYLARGRLIDWGGREALIEYLIDETERITTHKGTLELLNGLPGGAGIFNYYPDGRLEQVYLNDGYFAMLGSSREDRASYTGFSTVDAVHPEDVQVLKTKIEQVIGDKDYTGNVDLRLRCGSTGYTWINIRAKLAYKKGDVYVIFASYSDIDERKKMQLHLEASHRAIDLASANGRISIWMYNIDQKRIMEEFQVRTPFGRPGEYHAMPDSYLASGELFPKDEAAFRQLYIDMENGKESCECTVRIMNRALGHYEWQHITYTRIYDQDYTDRMAIGFSSNVDLQHELQKRYEHELHLRQELIRNSLIYYQLNLTNLVVEEYNSKIEGMPDMCIGTSIDEPLREKLLEHVLPEDRELVYDTVFSEALLEQYKHGKSDVSCQYRRILPGVGQRWFKASATIMTKPDSGEIVAFLYFTDIDRQKKDQLAVESIMDEEIESLAIVNTLTGLARLVRVRKEYDAPPKDEDFEFDAWAAYTIHSEVLEEDTARCEGFFYIHALKASLEKESIAKLTYRIRDAHGKLLRKKVRAFYLDDTHEEVILIRRDITDLYEEEQRQKHRLEKAVNAANEANHAKSDFLSRMSHDMRTPLNAIIALSGTEMGQDVTVEERLKYFDDIHTSGEYLLGIINDVLDMSRIENKKMVLRPVSYSVDEFVQTVQTVVGEQCHEKNIRFVFNTSGYEQQPLLLDKVRFNQIFVNLLSNAVKFTPPGGTVELTMERLEAFEGGVRKRFTVRDTGIGMSPEFLPRAFDSFAQENRLPGLENNQGTGLGLAIVKQIVDMMGGTIRVQSELGKGTTFTVELPLRFADAADLVPEKPVDLACLSGATVLLCEDHPLNTQIAVQLLRMKGCTAETAPNGQVGVEMFAASPLGKFGAILMDIRMPVMDGLSAAKAIRALNRPDAKAIPIIAMTADAFNEDVQSSRDAGMNAHLTKPIEPKILYDTLARCLQAAKG